MGMYCAKHQEQENKKKHDGMNNSGYRQRTASVVDVRHGAGYGSVAGIPPNSGVMMLAAHLRDEFRIRIVTVAYHTVGHSCRQQRFDGTVRQW